MYPLHAPNTFVAVGIYTCKSISALIVSDNWNQTVGFQFDKFKSSHYLPILSSHFFLRGSNLCAPPQAHKLDPYSVSCSNFLYYRYCVCIRKVRCLSHALWLFPRGLFPDIFINVLSTSTAWKAPLIASIVHYSHDVVKYLGGTQFWHQNYVRIKF